MYSSELAGVDAWAAAGCGCGLCAAGAATESESAEAAPTIDGGEGAPDSSAAESGVLALLSGAKWTHLDLTYAFPDEAADFTYDWYGEQAGFSPVNSAQIGAIEYALNAFEAVTELTFTQLTGAADREADMAFAQSDYAATAYGYYPSFGDWGGDAWFKPSLFGSPEMGNYAWSTIMHEIGHTLGLKHGHETGGAGAIPLELNSHEYSIMTYKSYVGASGSHYSNAQWSGPQTPMMLDIAALQTLYGANYEAVAGDTVYRAAPTSGVFTIDGVAQIAPGGNVILRTVWDGGGVDTYDFSAYRTDIAIDLSPGGYSDLDVGGQAQRAKLGPAAYARGHVFNALLFEDDERSLIENAIAGAGDDALLGNQTANLLSGGDGDDALWGGQGDDTLEGGDGVDVAVYDMALSAYVVSAAGDGLQISGDGVDIVRSDVEFATFAGEAHAVTDLLVGNITPDELPAKEEEAAAEEANAISAQLQTVGMRLRGDGRDDRMVGGVGDDTLIGAGGDDALRGAAGDDAVRGGGGGDRLMGGGGEDIAIGGAGRDRLQGGGGSDTLKGGGGEDSLIGGRGDDVLIGGGGADRLKGGAGVDRFVFRPGQDIDRIVDFRAGEDVLDLTARGASGFDALVFEQAADAVLVGDEVGQFARLHGVLINELSESDFVF